MTWNQFVEKIETELERQNIPRDVEIHYIDIGCDDPQVTFEHNLGIYIS